jgi:Asp-tRNA(Asn)/Glu-tRNA(Gln) amidotransferase A subunit family amidase
MESAGAITLGKLAMTQLAWGMMGQTPGRPACRNPHDPERVPGGSSSGSAVAVAVGIVDHAPGTDAGGSVRHPAASCGVVGFKPTYGTVPLDGCMPYAPSFDTGGAIARTVAEAALQHSVIADAPSVDLAGGLAGLRIGYLGGYFTAALDDDVAAMLERVRGLVAGEDVDIGWERGDNRAMGPIFTAEPGAYVLEHDPEPRSDRYDATTLEDVEAARTLPAIDYLRGRAELEAARRRCAAAASGFDVLLSASAPCAPVPIDGPDRTTRMNALTKPFNGLGWPALSLPAGRDRDGLPLSLQVAAPHGRDALVLRAGAALEALL